MSRLAAEHDKEDLHAKLQKAQNEARKSEARGVNVTVELQHSEADLAQRKTELRTKSREIKILKASSFHNENRVRLINNYSFRKSLPRFEIASTIPRSSVLRMRP